MRVGLYSTFQTVEAYGVDFHSLYLLKTIIFSERYHCVKIGSCKSGWVKLLSGVPQGSVKQNFEGKKKNN